MNGLNLFVAVFGCGWLLTALVRFISLKLGFVSLPRKDRWNERSVALGGGVAITFSISAGILYFNNEFKQILLPCLALLAIIGLIDDIRGVGPAVKVLAQLSAACYVVGQGIHLPITGLSASFMLSVIWIIGITNAFNLLDNMDGIAAGVSTIAAFSAALVFKSAGSSEYFSLSLVACAASLGFLIHNFHPARIFMGDAGSLVLGFLIAVISSQMRFNNTDIALEYSLFLPALVLIVPVFDTALVMILRKNALKPIMSGGRDHSTHRLAALGLSEKRVAFVLYLFSAMGGALALVLLRQPIPLILILSALGFGGALLFGIFLTEVSVYKLNPEQTSNRKLNRLPDETLLIAQILLDVCAVSIAWTLAHFIRFYDSGSGVLWGYKENLIIPTLPYLILIKLSFFLAFGLYRGAWRSFSIDDVFRIFVASTTSSCIWVGALALIRHFENVSRIVVVLDWLLTFVILFAIRAAISAFRRWSGRVATQPLRAAFLNPDELWPLTEKLLSSRVDLVGIISSNSSEFPRTKRLGHPSELNRILASHEIQVLIVPEATPRQLVDEVSNQGKTVKVIRLSVE